MSTVTWLGRCDIDGCERDAWWQLAGTEGGQKWSRVDCVDHPYGWPSTPLNDPSRPPALKETA